MSLNLLILHAYFCFIESFLNNLLNFSLQISMNVAVIHVNMVQPASIKSIDFNATACQDIQEYVVKLVRFPTLSHYSQLS